MICSWSISKHLEDRGRVHLMKEVGTESNLQRNVASSLDRIGFAYEYEHVTDEGLSIDMANVESKIVIEVEGPSHFLKSSTNAAAADMMISPPKYNGSTKFKERLLRKLGWKVVHVPYYEWDRFNLAGRDQSEQYLAQDDYMRSLLK